MTQVLDAAPARRALPSPSLADLLALLGRRNLYLTLHQIARKYGDGAHVKVGSLEIFILNHPDDIREVLVVKHADFYKGLGVEMTSRLLGQGLLTSEGEFHKRQRKLVQPAFHRQRLLGYGATMVEAAAERATHWQDGETVDMSAEMMSLTLGIVGKALFNVDVERDAPFVRRCLAIAMEAFIKVGLSPWAKQLERLPLPIHRRFYRMRDELDTLVYRIIDEHRSSGKDQGDLLSMLLMAQDEAGGGMSNEQLRDEVITLLMAGHETVSNALTWTWYLLAQHPEVAARLHEELDSVLGDDQDDSGETRGGGDGGTAGLPGRLPTLDDLPRLSYTEMVLSEAMRLYPPVWSIDRRAIRDTEIRGLHIPKDARVVMSQYAVHRDPHYYPDPERFDPERWRPEARAERPKFAYFPFGGGPRLCIGESFAWMEATLVLAVLARHWEAQVVSGHPVVPEAAVTLRPRYGIRMKLRRRQVQGERAR